MPRWRILQGGHDKPDNPNECDKCGSTNCKITRGTKDDPWDMRRCNSCGNEWITPW